MQTPLPPPIPDPRESDLRRAKKQGVTFRVRFLPVFLVTCIINLVVWYVILRPTTTTIPTSKLFSEAAIGLAITFAGSLAGAVAGVASTKVRVTEDLLLGANAWSFPTEVAWDDIVEVQRVNFMVLQIAINGFTQERPLATFVSI